MNKKLKVLHIITDLPIGGAQDNTLYTLELLDRDKYEVSFACNMTGEFRERTLAIADCKLHDIQALQRDVHPWADWQAYRALKALIRSENYDIVHTHSTKPGVLGRIAAFREGTPLVIHTVHGFPFHDFMNPLKRWLYIWIEKLINIRTHHLITVSTLNLQKIVDLGMAGREKLTNIYSGIDVGRFTSSGSKDLHAELDLPRDTQLVGFVGRFSDQKSPFTMLEAIVRVVKTVRNVHFIFVGDGPLREDMETFVQTHELEAYISFLGYRHDVHEILHGLDLFALSSIYEGLGRSVTEALCCKVPVVATAVEGVPELVRHEETGLLVEPRNSVKFAEALIWALQHPSEMRDMAAAGFRFVDENFQVGDMVNRIDDLYMQLYEDLEKQGSKTTS